MRRVPPGAPAPPARAAARAVVAALATLVALAAAAGAAHPVAAQPVPPAAAGDGDAPAAARDALQLVAQTDWVTEGGTFTIRVEVPDGTSEDAVLVLDLHRAVTSRSQFTATQTGDLLGRRIAEVVVPLTELPEMADGSRRIHLSPTPSGAPGERALPSLTSSGVHPLVVSLRPADPAAEPPTPFVTYLVRTPEEVVQPLLVAVAQPFEADVATRTDGTPAVAPATVAELGALADVLAASDVPVTVAPRGETLEALAQLAAAGDAEAGDALAALREAVGGDTVVSTPYVDVDPDALVAAGLGADLAAQRERGDEVVAATLGARTDPRMWLADDGIGERVQRRLVDLGVRQVVLPDAELEPVTLRLTLSRPFELPVAGEGRALEAAAPDPALAARYGAADQALAAQRLLADLAVLHGDEPGAHAPRGVVVAPPRGTEVDPGFLAEVLAGIDSARILRPVPLGEWFADVAPETDGDEVLVRATTASTDRLGISAAEVRSVRADIAGFAQVVAGGAGEDLAEELVDLTLVAEADGLAVDARRAYLAEVGARIAGVLSSVGLVESAAFRLPDSEGTIPLTLVQQAPFPLRVRVTLASDKLEFLGDGGERSIGRVSYDLTLTEVNTPLVVPVSVRSPGTFPLVVTITSPDGELQILATRVTVRSTAFSGVGIALSVGAGAFLLVWWGRHWRTVRRAKRLVPAP